MPFSREEVHALLRGDEDEITRVFGYKLARCPNGEGVCFQDAEWGHPCDRDERGEYICEREG